MTNDDSGLKTRRAVLTAAAAGAAALAAQAISPLAAQAHDADDLQLAAVNLGNGTTTLNSNALDVDAFVVRGANDNLGSGLVAVGARAPGIRAYSGVDAAVYAINGDETHAASQSATASTGVYGYTPTSPDPSTITGSGVWGDSPDIGVVGTGGLGMYGSGHVGVEGDGFGSGGIGMFGFAGDPGTVGVQAYAGAPDRIALKVTGKASVSRSGRTSIPAKARSKVVSLAGVTSTSLVFAVLATNRSGRWIQAVVPATGKFTVYVNAAVTAATTVAWWVLN
jgi:hypothetical protein